MNDGCTMDGWMDLRTSWYVVEKEDLMAAGWSPSFGDQSDYTAEFLCSSTTTFPESQNAEYETPTALLLFLLMMYKILL